MAILAFTVRPATLADCESIAQVHMDSIQSLGSKHYSTEVIGNWGAFRTAERYVQAMANGTLFFIAIVNSSKDEQQVAGFSSYSFVNSKHRTAIYVDGRFARCGIGKALFTAAENEAQKNRAEQIDIDASLGAVPFYKAMGFEESGIGEHQLRGGLSMPCVFMRKLLPAR